MASANKLIREGREATYPVAVWSVRCEKCGAAPFEKCWKKFAGKIVPMANPHLRRVALSQRMSV